MASPKPNRRRRSQEVDPVIERPFAWLRDLGFEGFGDPKRFAGPSAMYISPNVIVDIHFDYRDVEPEITVARRIGADLDSQPYWTRVRLEELAKRAGRDPRWSRLDGREDHASLEAAFARGATLLREVAFSQLKGESLEVLDELIAARPHYGVPGLDFPVEDPWYPSQEGIWMFELGGKRIPFHEAIEQTRSADPMVRATAALQLQGAGGVQRLGELLDDAEAVVRRAAASALVFSKAVSTIPRLLELLERETGGDASPIAAAAAFLAIDADRPVRISVAAALDRFAGRGRPAELQVRELRWRIDDHPRGYPWHIKAYLSPPTGDA